MRYLFVTVDSAGGLFPQLALAQRTRARGHEVRFLACRSQRAAIEAAGFDVRTYSGAPDIDMTAREGAVRDWLDHPEVAFRACCDHIWFGPAAAIAVDVVAELADRPADALAIDYFAFGAAVAAEAAGVPAAILWHTGFGEWSGFNAGLAPLNAARERLGLGADASVYDAYHRAPRLLVLTTERFDFALGPQPAPANLRHVGPQLAPGEEPDGEPAGGGAKPSVLVSLSTSYQAQEGLLSRVVEALGGLPVDAVVTTGPAVSLDEAAPANVEIRPWLPHSAVLPRTDLVVTHAGMGTVMAAMAHGVPLLCLPMGRDQHGNASRVAALGFGHTGDPGGDVDELRRGIDAALADAQLKRRARELAADCCYDCGAVELELVTAARTAP